MDIQAYETLITTQLEELVGNIINANPRLNIAVKKGERVGDGISKFLENKFVEFTQNHQYFKESLASPEGKTKNPFDVQTIFEINEHKELIWIDFKAVNLDNDDSNADSGTFNKVIYLIQNGAFYLTYIYVYYRNSGINEMEFSSNVDGDLVKVYFLKNIGENMHITPNNQMQVNFQEGNVDRTREEFINFFIEKVKKSYEYRSLDSKDMLEKLANNEIRLGKYKEAKPPKVYKREPKIKKEPLKQTISFEELKKLNQEQEEKIKNL